MHGKMKCYKKELRMTISQNVRTGTDNIFYWYGILNVWQMVES